MKMLPRKPGTAIKDQGPDIAIIERNGQHIFHDKKKKLVIPCQFYSEKIYLDSESEEEVHDPNILRFKGPKKTILDAETERLLLERAPRANRPLSQIQRRRPPVLTQSDEDEEPEDIFTEKIQK